MPKRVDVVFAHSFADLTVDWQEQAERVKAKKATEQDGKTKTSDGVDEGSTVKTPHVTSSQIPQIDGRSILTKYRWEIRRRPLNVENYVDRLLLILGGQNTSKLETMLELAKDDAVFVGGNTILTN